MPTTKSDDAVVYDELNGELNRKLRMGLVGGGHGAFIGNVHVIAATMDGRAELVAGALASDPERARKSAPAYGILPDRAYGDVNEMLQKEKELPPDQRIDFVSIATPNHTHFPIAKAALEAGFNVVCDKPMTFNLDQASSLIRLVEDSGAVFVLTHNYTGYPLVTQLREMILNGDLGDVWAIRSNYIQGWLQSKLEADDQKQAAWRTDPNRSGAAGAFGDIGTHAYNLVRFTTGLIPSLVWCNLRTFVEGRKLDDYGVANVHFHGNALATITASQISHGRENDLRLEIDGTKGSAEFNQENPNELIIRRNGKPRQIYTRDPNGGFLAMSAAAGCRIPSGHPEGYFEAFANVYRSAFDAITLRAIGQKFELKDTLYPNVYDGFDGMHFIQQCVASSNDGGIRLGLNHEHTRI